MYYMGFTYMEAYGIPVWQRIWFIKRMGAEIKRASKQGDVPSRAAHHNDPVARELTGKHRPAPPARLRRFS